MKQSFILITFILAMALAHAFSPALAADPAPLSVVKELGTVNGQAMACSESGSAQRAKSLMLAHAPKTDAFGEAFQAGTAEGFAAQTKTASACPSVQSFAVRLAHLETQLQAVLPIKAIQ